MHVPFRTTSKIRSNHLESKMNLGTHVLCEPAWHTPTASATHMWVDAGVPSRHFDVSSDLEIGDIPTIYGMSDGSAWFGHTVWVAMAVCRPSRT
jgi:hypothetical protein